MKRLILLCFVATSLLAQVPGWKTFSNIGSSGGSTSPAAPTNWTVQTNGAVSGPNAMGQSIGVHNSAAICTVCAQAADVELRYDYKFHWNGTTAQGPNPMAVMRSDVNGAASIAVDAVVMDNMANIKLYVFSRASGYTWTSLVSGSLFSAVFAPALTEGTVVSVRVQAQGTALRFRIWRGDQTEPGTWLYNNTLGTMYTTSGYVGISMDNFNGSTPSPARISPASWMTIDNLVVTDLSTSTVILSNSFDQSLVASPSVVATNSTGTTIALTGSGTSWDGGTTTFSLSGGTGASITAQSVTDGTHATLTLTAGSAVGALTITNSSDSSVGSISVTLATVSVPVTDANWFFSPYNTFTDGAGTVQSNNVKASSTYALWTNAGAYFTTKFGGTLFLLDVNTTANNVSPRPKVRYSVDNGPWTTYQITGSETSLTLASGLASTTHTLVCYLLTTDNNSDRWNGAPPPQSLKITGGEVDSGQALSAPVLQSKRYLIFGDSITEGTGTEADFRVTGVVATSDARHSWTYAAAHAMGADYGAVGFGAQGWVGTGQGNVPAFPTAWSSYFSGQSRLIAGKLSPIPDAVIVNHGTNDGSTNIVATVRTWLTAARAAVNSTTPIFLVVPFGQYQAANLQAAVTAQADPNVYVVNLGSSVSTGLTGYGSANAISFDGIHPDRFSSPVLGGDVARAIAATGSVSATTRAWVGFQ